jgi:hypothetical protein
MKNVKCWKVSEDLVRKSSADYYMHHKRYNEYDMNLFWDLKFDSAETALLYKEITKNMKKC